ncbi:nucleoside deaminase [Permianibacter sp. IMCC34836]|uniref:nucleoside deaminase n=1 Tax=Permianibacter fluminis TaxID=2738515 RepID=UPI001554067E|nr:nucleoside deaminase [Permianibacter fluminis]NQD35739.1 nucleoside deaminase [Permianibacter fluminis]
MNSELTISLPGWVRDEVDFGQRYPDDPSRMALAVQLARRNVEQDSGGPFGAAIFDQHSGELLSVGVNRVVPLHNCTLHAEMLAFMFAQQRVGSHSLNQPGQPSRTLYTSCSPCAMCLGASLWSGVRRIVIAARREDAQAIGFEEGPVFPASEQYLRERGMVIDHDVLRDEGRAVLQRYAELDRLRYNG